MIFRANWHGLSLEAEGLKYLISAFAQQAHSGTRTEGIRLKDWLQISLAYDFSPSDSSALRQLATETIDLADSVAWELRFYQRAPQNQWTCHRRWPLFQSHIGP